MDEDTFLNGEGRVSPMWCGHFDTIPDDEGHAICVQCHAAVAPPAALTEDLLWAAADAIWMKDYHGPGLPPSFQRRLE